jgi:hypothetical protein
MIYKHWKKAALALTALFWASCDETSSTSPIEVSQEPGSSSSSTETLTAGSSETVASSSSVGTESSSEGTESSSTGISSSSEEKGISSANQPESSSSSDFGIEVVPLYGVRVDQYTCTEDSTSSPTPESDSTMTFKCSDGATCIATIRERMGSLPCTGDGLEAMCPAYGIISIHEKTYTCSDGTVYNEAEFLSRYNILTKVQDDREIQDSVIALYGVIQTKEN